MARKIRIEYAGAVGAKVVSAERLLDYRWSSLPLFAEGSGPKSLVAETVLAEAGGLAYTKAGWRKYAAYLGVLAEEEANRRGERFGRPSRGWAIGSAEFKAGLKEELRARNGDTAVERFELAGADRKAQREARAEVWEERLRAFAGAIAQAEASAGESSAGGGHEDRDVGVERLARQAARDGAAWRRGPIRATVSTERRSGERRFQGDAVKSSDMTPFS